MSPFKARGAYMTVTNFEEMARNATERLASEAVKREQSSILFPYLDLDTAIEVARAVYNRSGHSACELHELAAEMKQVVSGAFRLKTGTARIFGLTNKEGRGGIQVSELGLRILDPDTERAARIEAFLNVPLYEKVYEKFKGQRLPPAKALEREMQVLGVSGKQTDKARQTFERSAKQAGYFDSGDDRLVRPRSDVPLVKPEPVAGLDQAPSQSESSQTAERHNNGGGGGGNGSGGEPPPDKNHPLIQGLLLTLPRPGDDWDIDGRASWLRMGASIFDMIYKGSGGIIQVAVKNDNSG
jgi:hypothetical protein